MMAKPYRLTLQFRKTYVYVYDMMSVFKQLPGSQEQVWLLPDCAAGQDWLTPHLCLCLPQEGKPCAEAKVRTR